MSRKYMIDRWCVRCGKEDPSPFTKRCFDRIMNHYDTYDITVKNMLVVDVGCGNGRNAAYCKGLGFNVRAFDMNPDFGEKLILGRQKIPMDEFTADIVLANYSLMFLDESERTYLLDDIAYILKPGGMFIWELYPAKDSYCKNANDLSLLQKYIVDNMVEDLKMVYQTKDKGFYSGIELIKKKR